MTLTWTLLLDADMTLEGWQYSLATDADLLRIDQENVPELGRFSLAQVSPGNNEFLNIQGYPARGESVRITPEHVTDEPRLIAVEHGYSQYPDNIPGNWRVKVYGAKSGFQPTINPSAIVLTLDPRVAGAIPLEEKGIALGVATLNEDGVVPDDQLPNSEWMELLGANLEATDALALQISGHTSDTSNPHAVTLAQIGAEPSGAEIRANSYTDLKISELPSGTPPTLESLGAEAAGTAAAAIAAHTAGADPHSQYAESAELASHTANTNNPHAVTLAQIGAEPSGAEIRANSYTDLKINALEYPSHHLHVYGYGVPPAGKSFTVTLNTSAELGRFANLNTTAVGDAVEYECSLKSGSYRMSVYGQRNTTRGISVFYVDGKYIGSYDWQNGGAVQRQLVTFDFTIATSGVHVIKIAHSQSSGVQSVALSSIAIHALSGIKQIREPIRINCGANADYADPSGNLFSKDFYGVGATAYPLAYSGAIDLTTADTLYQSERSTDSGTFTYTLPITVPGTYQLKLHFCENYYDNGEYSTRPLGTVALNGSNLLSNFSIFNEAGGQHRALIKTFNDLTLTNQCQLSFTNTLINAIELI